MVRGVDLVLDCVIESSVTNYIHLCIYIKNQPAGYRQLFGCIAMAWDYSQVSSQLGPS